MDHFDPAVQHRNIFRGKNLGTEFTDEQLAHIKDGSFKDLYVGDYWEIDDNKWRIADIDYFTPGLKLATDEEDNSEHHLVIMQDIPKYLDLKPYNTNTSLGYVGSNVRLYLLEHYNDGTVIPKKFSDNLFSYKSRLSNSVNSEGDTIANVSVDAYLELPAMNQIIGYFPKVISSQTNLANNIYDVTQLSLFRLNSSFIWSKVTFFLRDIATYNNIMTITGTHLLGNMNCIQKSNIRPVFAIG